MLLLAVICLLTSNCWKGCGCSLRGRQFLSKFRWYFVTIILLELPRWSGCYNIYGILSGLFVNEFPWWFSRLEVIFIKGIMQIVAATLVIVTNPMRFRLVFLLIWVGFLAAIRVISSSRVVYSISLKRYFFLLRNAGIWEWLSYSLFQSQKLELVKLLRNGWMFKLGLMIHSKEESWTTTLVITLLSMMLVGVVTIRSHSVGW